MTRKLLNTALAIFALSLAALAQTAGNAPAAPAAAPAAAAAPPAAAAPTGPPATKIGIIYIQQAIMASNEGQRDFGALEKKFEPRRSELQAANTEVENLKKQLQTQGDKLNDGARNDLIKSIDSKQKVLQRNFEDFQNDVVGQQNEIANRIGQKMLEVLEKYAVQNGYAVVLDVSNQQQSPVLWASAATNITKAIVDAYNAQSGVAAPAAAPAPAAKPASHITKPAAPAAKPAAPAAQAKKP